MFQKIALIGAGSMGTILGAYITKAGYDITLVDANKDHVNALKASGAKCTGYADLCIPVKACLPEELEGTFDLFLFMAKQTYNEATIPQMIAHCHKDSIICCFQNGIPEFAVAKYWPEKQICGAPMGWGAVWKEPGVSEMINPMEVSNFHLGSLDGSTPDWIYEIKTILESMVPTIVTENLMSDRWAKLLINSAFSGMSTVMGCDYGEVMDDEYGIQCVTKLCKETVLVAQAAGVKLVPFVVDFEAICSYTDHAGQVAAQEALREGFATRRGTVASMLQDLQKGRRCEIPQLDGLVADVGDQYGVDTPVTDMVVKIVNEIEAGKRTFCKENVKDFIAVL